MASLEKIQEQFRKHATSIRADETAKRVEASQKERARFQELRRNGVLFSEKLFTMRGKPMRFDDFPYASQVFQDRAKTVVLLWARSMSKTTTIASILAHKLVTNAYSGVMVAAPRDKQAWRVTKEHIRPRFTESAGKMLLSLLNGKNTESEIEVANGSRYYASGAWVTGNSLRGPHVNWGFADEMQDWTREAFDVFREVVNLPPAQIFCAGTPKNKGSFFEELWRSSDMKEWDGKGWVITNPTADPDISGYHITQEFSPFVTPAELESKRKKMMPRLFANEVMAQFYAAGGVKPVTSEMLMGLLIKKPEDLHSVFFTEKSLGVDWGDESRWVLVGKATNGNFYVLDTGVFDDVDTLQHVEKSKRIISRETPRHVICDSGYGKTKNQMLFKAYPGIVWSVFTNSSSPMPVWTVVRSIDQVPLPPEDYQYHISVNHTAMCENTENLINRRRLHISYLPGQEPVMDVLMYEMVQADTEEVVSATGKQRRFTISDAHAYAAISYALIPYSYEQDMGESVYDATTSAMMRMPRFARRRVGRQEAFFE